MLAGQVAKIFPDQGLLVRLPMYKYGVVGLTDLSDNYEENPLESFTTMQLVRWANAFIYHYALEIDGFQAKKKSYTFGGVKMA